MKAVGLCRSDTVCFLHVRTSSFIQECNKDDLADFKGLYNCHADAAEGSGLLSTNAVCDL